MNNNNLQLSLKTKWFRMTEARIKPEDYREITDYWIKRLCKGFLMEDGSVRPLVFPVDISDYHRLIFKSFDYNIMTLGYPKSTDTSRILKLEHKGIEIRNGNPEWGAEPSKLYFVIKHGEKL